MLVTSDLRDWENPRPAAGAAAQPDDLEFDLGDLGGGKDSKRDPFDGFGDILEPSLNDSRNAGRARRGHTSSEIELDELDDVWLLPLLVCGG